ncbi:trp operon leader peptide [Salmonella enterica subsp. enterica serovar Derby]|nr:trp operon leader peptide [Citrobacter freundii]MBJ3560714.1 trp operon leader peptide [Salmonella enterica subsp. enterica serovar Derby]MBJ4957414.1 trp operon leader peptide [Salmonella enterica subsp. enterica serovar Goldcoast]
MKAIFVLHGWWRTS